MDISKQNVNTQSVVTNVCLNTMR